VYSFRYISDTSKDSERRGSLWPSGVGPNEVFESSGVKLKNGLKIGLKGRPNSFYCSPSQPTVALLNDLAQDKSFPLICG